VNESLVSIAIPTLERLNYLKEAVASALAQTHRRVEILIGDDGRDESLRDWCLGQAGTDARVRYLRNEKRLGLAGNWNALADAARGEYLVIIGDDDRLLPRFVSTLLRAATPRTSVVFANHYLIDESGRRLEAESVECTRAYARDALAEGYVSAAAAVWRNSVPICASLIRGDDARRLRFKEDLNTPEIEFFIRLANEGGGFTFIPEYLSEYRTHPNSATASGLLSERLAPYLIPLPAPSGAEKYKRRFMAPLLADAVGRSLQRGDRETARVFLRSHYYPWPRLINSGAASRPGGDENGGGVRDEDISIESRDGGSRGMFTDLLRGGVHGLCAWLPSSIGCPAYRALRRLKAGLTS
jgi:glycosyltransferase involved in cell wall biosynthesis